MVEDSSIIKRAYSGGWFLFWWVIVTVITVDLAALVGFLGYNGLFLGEGAIHLSELLIVAVPSSLLIGCGQWILLRRYISPSGQWILTTLIGGVIGSVMTWFVLMIFDVDDRLFVSFVLLALISQMLNGILQGRILFSRFPTLDWVWWLLANVTGMAGTSWMGTRFIGILFAPDWTLYLFSLVGMPFGVFTGLVLMRLLRQ